LEPVSGFPEPVEAEEFPAPGAVDVLEAWAGLVLEEERLSRDESEYSLPANSDELKAELDSPAAEEVSPLFPQLIGSKKVSVKRSRAMLFFVLMQVPP